MTETAVRKKGGNRRLWLGMAGLLVVLVIAFAICVNVAADRAWKRMEERHAKDLAEVKARTHEREALYGATTEGEAWDSYSKALALFGKGVVVEWFERKRLCGNDEAGRAEARRLKEISEDLCRLIRKGAHARRAGYPMEWEKGLHAPIPSLLHIQNAANLMAGRAIELQESGEEVQAVRTLLDLAQFSEDNSRNGTLIGAMLSVAGLGTCFEVIEPWMAEGTLGLEARQVLLQGMTVLERQRSSVAEVYANERILLDALWLRGREPFLGGGLWSPGSRTPRLPTELLQTWRYGFSPRLTIAKSSEGYSAFADEVSLLLGNTWKEIEVGSSGLVTKYGTESGNPVLEIIIPSVTAAPRSVYESRAHLAMIRAALLLPVDHEFPEHPPNGWPADPFGEGPLKYERAADGKSCRIWSVGKDATDNRGSGEWRPVGADIVMEVHGK